MRARRCAHDPHLPAPPLDLEAVQSPLPRLRRVSALVLVADVRARQDGAALRGVREKKGGDMPQVDPQTILRTARCVVSRMLLPKTVAREDAQQEAALGFLRAMRRFDPARGLKPITLGHHAARGAVLDYLRTLDPLGRTERRQVKSEGAEEPVTVLSLSELDLDLIADQTFAPADDLAAAGETVRTVARAMRALPDREWQVVMMLFWCEMPVVEVARRLGVSWPRVYQLRTRALGQLRDALGERL
jgi:RNA polymerase sigma factor (sigma-70 family)